jgi:hypothetical protein
MDRFSKYRQISDTLRNQVCELELVSRLYLADGTTQEVTNVRRAVCKKASRRQNVTILTLADIDRSALERVFPFETFTVADFPEIFVDHVGRRIPQGVGTARKVPLTWITKTGGTWKYAATKVLGAPGTVLTVYRGNQHGQGAIVDPSEYTVSTAVGASTGVQVLTIVFTQEQLDDNGRAYALDADLTLPGSRLPSDEAKRIIEAYGLTADAATFATAAAADTAAGFAVDTLYGGLENGRMGSAIIADLLGVARGWLSPTTTGAWAIAQDVAKASVASFDTSADQIEVEEYGDGDIEKTVTLDYRPRSSVGEDYTGHLSRTTTGQTGEKRVANPYIYEHVVADKLLCYWQKRLNTLRRGSAIIHAVQLANGSVVSITDNVAYTGTKDFIMTGIRRPADRNQVNLREYDAAVYVYTAGTLPADATSGYSPDYSYTPPAAPTGLTVVSGGATVAADGTMRSYALIRATPPAVNWERLMIQVTNSVSGEIYQAQLRLNGPNYEARITGMHPSVAHTVIAWAVNANNIDGVPTASVGFTSTTVATDPAVPTGLTVVSSANAIDENQVQTSYVVLRATPPANYFRRMMAQVTNTVSGEVYQAEFILGGGNWDAKIEGLRANTAHNAIAWAVNFENVAGAQTSPVSFTTPITGTSPDVPTGLTKASGGTTVNPDGSITAYALIRATPPANYFRSMHCRVKNNVTGGFYFGTLILNAGNYEATITGLHPNVSHDVIAWARNANDVWSAFTTPLTFTSDTVSTSPAVPTSLAKISGGTTADANGVVRAYALIRAVPPAQYFKLLKAQVKDTTTGALQQLELKLNAGNYEARFDGLLANRGHEVIAWAVNASGDDGAVTTPVSFTSDNYSTAPGTPGSISVEQRSPRQMRVGWASVAPVAGAPALNYYLLERQVGSGSNPWNERAKVYTTEFVDDSVDLGTAYNYRVSAIDMLGNASGVRTAAAAVTPAALIADSLITALGVGSGSLNTNAVTPSKINAAAVGAAKVDWSYTINNYVSMAAGAVVGIGAVGVALVPWVELTAGGNTSGVTITGSTGGGSVALGARNDTGGAINLTVKDPVFN